MEKEIISDFKQGTVIISNETKNCLQDYKNGNCVTIALIKAALVEFGSIENIFETYKTLDNETTVSFKSSLSITVNQEEIKLVEQISGIIPKENSIYYKSATKLFAIIAKRILYFNEQYSSSCIKSFKNAVEYLNSGYSTKSAHELLELKKVPIKIKHIKKKKSAIIYSNAHASYSSYGDQDIFGKSNRITQLGFVSWMKNPKGIGGVILGAYILNKP